MAGVSPEIVLERFTNSFPSSCSLTKILNAVFVGGVRHGKLAVGSKTKASKREPVPWHEDKLHEPSTGPIWVSGGVESSK